MKKILFLFSLAVASHAMAQAYPAQQLHYNGHTAEIQPVVVDDRRAEINIRNPNGNENVVMDVQEDDNGQITVITRDKNTGEVLSTIKGREDQYVDSTSDFGGVRQDMHLRQVNDDVTGTIGYSNKNTGEELFAEVLGSGRGVLKQTKKGYKMSLKLSGTDDATVVFTNAKTNEVICAADDSKGKVRVYDKAKKLIAEGLSEADEPSHIYDRAAYAQCEKVMEIFDDDEDD